MKHLIFVTLFFISQIGISQDQNNYLYKWFKLNPKYHNLSNISEDSAARVIKTLSICYGNSKMKSKDTLYFYSKNSQYNLFQDSLTLYNLMSENKSVVNAENKFQKEEAPKFRNENVTFKNIKEEIATYEKNLKNHLIYVNRIKVPVSYKSFDLLLSVEKGDTAFCSYYNNGRIRAYSCRYDETPFNLAYHKTILPEYFESVKMFYSDWMPRRTFYKKPNIPIKTSIDSKLIWEKQTGLKYEVAVNLGIADDKLKMSRILYRMDQVKGYRLKDIQYNSLDNLVEQEKIFSVKCDTCLLQYYDHMKEDNDQVKIYYQDKELVKDTITNQKRELSIVVDKDESILYLEAISEGDIQTCTAYISFDNNEFVMSLNKGKICKIIIRKE